MSETLLTYIIVFAEIGGMLLLALLGWIIYYFYKAKKDGKNTLELARRVKEMLPKRRDKLTEHFKDELEQEDNDVVLKVDSLLKHEEKLYEHLINVSINKDTSLLKLTVDDINTLINDYVKMLTLKGREVSSNDSDSRELILRKENQALRMEMESLENRLQNATDTIENMMGEFSSMYEGGKKEGEQKVKNEMYKLKQQQDEEEAQFKAELKKIED